jgi:hypothetical protein
LRGEASETKREFGEKTWDKYILGSLTSKAKRDFGSGKTKKKTLDKNILGKSHFADEERLRGKERCFEDEERLRENSFADEERLRRKERDFGEN